MPRLPGEVDPRFVNPPGGGPVPDHTDESMDMASEDAMGEDAVSPGEAGIYGSLSTPRLKNLFEAALIAKNQAAAAQRAGDRKGEADAARALSDAMRQLNAELGAPAEPTSVRDAVRGAVGK